MTIEAYDFDSLVKTICNTAKPRRDERRVRSKSQIEYLKGYLEDPEIDCKTVMIEYDYIDRDYIEDYAFYYSRCFREVSRKCVRFHFFSNRFDEELWKSVVLRRDKAKRA